MASFDIDLSKVLLMKVFNQHDGHEYIRVSVKNENKKVTYVGMIKSTNNTADDQIDDAFNNEDLLRYFADYAVVHGEQIAD